jgi:hypothetical protein
MVAQASRRADDDVGPLGQHALLAPDVHAADAGRHPGAGRPIEPEQLAMDLERQLAGRRHHQDARHRRADPPVRVEQRRREGQPVGDGLAGPRLGGDQQVPAVGVGPEHGCLYGGRFRIAALVERAGKVGMGTREGHVG